ncbi:MAG: hypothetical protein IH608_02395 [Proteobacteria bacterium]|nr:hypothetical protein [Pseudomonadota bacterium]
MAQQEAFLENMTGMWGRQQMDGWLESANLFREQIETMMDLWGKQVAEAQKETQKFLTEWTSSIVKAQADLWQAWQASLEGGAQVFTRSTGSG